MVKVLGANRVLGIRRPDGIVSGSPAVECSVASPGGPAETVRFELGEGSSISQETLVQILTLLRHRRTGIEAHGGRGISFQFASWLYDGPARAEIACSEGRTLASISGDSQGLEYPCPDEIILDALYDLDACRER